MTAPSFHPASTGRRHRRHVGPRPRARRTSSHAHGARVAFVARDRERVDAGRSRPSRHPRHRRRRLVEGRHLPDRAADSRRARRPRRPHQQRVGSRTGSARAPRATPTARISSTRWPRISLGPFRLTKALLGALATSAREGQGAVVLNVSSDAAINAVSHVGRVRRKQGRAAPSHADLGCRAFGARACVSSRSIPATWIRRFTRSRCPTPIRATLKRPETAARELLDAIAARLLDAVIAMTRGRSARLQRPRRREAARRRCAAHRLHDVARPAFVDCLRPGDLVVANDAATLPASLHGTHVPTGEPIEVRLAGRRTLAPTMSGFLGGRLRRGRFSHAHRKSTAAAAARCRRSPRARTAHGNRHCHLLGHPRLVVAAFRRLRRHDLGRHRAPRPADSVRARAGAAGAVGRLDAHRGPACRHSSRRRRVSRSTGEPSRPCTSMASRSPPSRTRPEFHRPEMMSSTDRLPFDEPYEIPRSTATRDRRARARPADESSRSAPRSSARSSMRPRRMVAFERGRRRRESSASAAGTRLSVVDAILTGVHERGHEPLRVASRVRR